MIAGFEYNYIDLGSESSTTLTSPASATVRLDQSVDAQIHSFMGRISYKFGGDRHPPNSAAKAAYFLARAAAVGAAAAFAFAAAAFHVRRARHHRRHGLAPDTERRRLETSPPGHAGALGKEAWLRCDGCAHTVMVKPRDFAERHGLDMLTPLLTISRRMRCSRCGARKGGCRPAPHDTRKA